MPAVQIGAAPGSGSWKRPAVVLSLLLSLFGGAGKAADALRFDNNWFVTGDYQTAGVGLRGTGGPDGYAVGQFKAPTLLPGAQPIAAYLYWSSVEYETAFGAVDGFFAVEGAPGPEEHKIRGAVLGNPQANPGCWSSGGTVGPGAFGRVYRADVLRYFPVGPDNVRQVSGRTVTVRLRDSGGGGNGQVLYTDGATLLVIYRFLVPPPANPSAAKFRAVVAYDGAFTMPKDSPTGFNLKMEGFYDAGATPNAKVTFIVGNGGDKSQSPLYINNLPVASSPFVGALGGRWDNQKFDFNLAPHASSFSTSVIPGNNQTCLTFVAAIASMEVSDSDGDGLLDSWETKGLHRDTTAIPAATFGSCEEYPDSCVDLPKMGAYPIDHKDIFVELDWLKDTNGSLGNALHNHKPKPAALEAVCNAFAAQNIALHFDVGKDPIYQGVPCVVPETFEGKALALGGGDDIEESTLVCRNPISPHECVYGQQPVLSFGFGYASVRDGNALAGIDPHFSGDRKDTHHYGLFAHALAGPFNKDGEPVDPHDIDPETGKPRILPIPATPRSYSGIAQRPGGGFMVTLGMWRSDIPANDQVGSTIVQAGTLMHELGHNLGLGHAGLASAPTCMPNYPSIMNYLYQTRGLTDAAGKIQFDFSYGNLSPLAESTLGAISGTLLYRTRFYGPLGPGMEDAAAKLHCNGTPITADGALAARLEGADVGTPDWRNGTGGTGDFAFDANFNGIPGEAFNDHPDWDKISLQQIGSGLNFGGLSVGALATDAGALATDAGALATDAGALATDAGAFATDAGAFATDAGAFATDAGVFATDAGALATDAGALATDAGDEDYETHVASGPDAPTDLTAAVPTAADYVLLSWNPPGNGRVATYDIYRCADSGGGCTPTLFAPGYTPSSKAEPTYKDTVDYARTPPPAPTLFNTKYVYRVRANVEVTINGQTTVTASPLSNSDDATIPGWLVKADNKQRQYGAENPSPFTFTVAPPSPPLNVSGITCTTNGVQGSPVGEYPISCSGGPSTPANVRYIAGTLTIIKADTTTTIISVSPEPSMPGQEVTVSFSVALSPSGPALTSGGTVTVTGGGASCSVTLAAGECELTPTLWGNVTFTATYAGDGNTNGSTSAAKAHVVAYDVQIEPLKTPAKLGSAVPVVFQVKSSVEVVTTDLSLIKRIDSVYTGSPVSGVCRAPAPGDIWENLYDIRNGSTGRSSLRAITSPPADQFNWDTTTASTLPTITGSGCYYVVITLVDDVPRTSTYVLLR